MGMVKVQFQDEYLMDFIPGEHAGDFRVDVGCSNELLEGNDTAGSRDFHARRLVAAYSELDQWIDDMDDHEINYFYNLLMNGQMDRVMDAFYHDADYYYDDDYYGDYYEDETPSLGILVKTIKRFMAHKPYTGDDNDPDAFRYGFITDPEKCQPLGNWCQPMSYIHPDARSALTTNPKEYNKAQDDHPSEMAKQMRTATKMENYLENHLQSHPKELARKYCCSGYCQKTHLTRFQKVISEWHGGLASPITEGVCALTKDQKENLEKKRKALESAKANAFHSVVPNPGL